MIEKNGYVQLEKEETSSSWQQPTKYLKVCDNNKTGICDITDKKCQNNQNERKVVC